jgi:Protein of unknown function with HXXEE motif
VDAAERERELRRLLWLLPAAFALHEAEEWNLASWFPLHFTPRTEASDAGVRTLLVAFSLGAFLLTGFAARLSTLRATLNVLLPFFVVVAVGNALTHVFWWLYFGAYAPGVVTAALLVTPATLWVSLRAVQAGLVSRAWLGVLYLLAGLTLVPIVRAGATLTPGQLALHRLAARLGAWLWGAS